MTLQKYISALCDTLWKTLRTWWLNYFLPTACQQQAGRQRTQSKLTKVTKSFYVVIPITLLIVSCEKNITVKIPKASEEIVVEGIIETDTIAVVFLSRTLPFFGQINTSEILLNSIIGATVIVDDGTTFDTLLQINPLYGIYFGTTIRGTPGKKYRLTVIAGGKTLHSITSIPQTVKLDSVWWKPDGRRDSLGFAWAHLTDPDTIGNCYRWFAQRINHYTYGEDKGKIKDSTFIPAPGSAFDDKFINMKSFDFSFPRGKFQFSNKKDDSNNEQFLFKRGDTIVVKFCSIDRAHFEFWRTEETQVRNNGNPFGSPAPILSNIEGGLGIWGGYAPSYDTIIAR